MDLFNIVLETSVHYTKFERSSLKFVLFVFSLVVDWLLTLKCFLYYMCDAVLKFLFLNKEGIIEKFSYERRAYESVDEKSLS